MNIVEVEDISNDTKKITGILYALHSAADELPEELMEWALLGTMEMTQAVTKKADKIIDRLEKV